MAEDCEGQLFPKLRLKIRPNLVQLAGGTRHLPITNPKVVASPGSTNITARSRHQPPAEGSGCALAPLLAAVLEALSSSACLMRQSTLHAAAVLLSFETYRAVAAAAPCRCSHCNASSRCCLWRPPAVTWGRLASSLPQKRLFMAAGQR